MQKRIGYLPVFTLVSLRIQLNTSRFSGELDLASSAMDWSKPELELAVATAWAKSSSIIIHPSSNLNNSWG